MGNTTSNSRDKVGGVIDSGAQPTKVYTFVCIFFSTFTVNEWKAIIHFLLQLEFAVKMSCNSCVEQIRSKLDGVSGIDNINIDLATGSVVVETSLPSYEIQHRIQSTGKDVILRGIGGKGRYTSQPQYFCNLLCCSISVCHNTVS